MKRYVYEVHGLKSPDGDLFRACTSKPEAAHWAASFAEAGAKFVRVIASRPLPRAKDVPYGTSHSSQKPTKLPGTYETIALVLNGKWYSERYLLIEFVPPYPGDIYTQAERAKVGRATA